MTDLDFGVIARSWPYLLGGLQYTVQLTITAAIGGTIFGTLLALARLVGTHGVLGWCLGCW